MALVSTTGQTYEASAPGFRVTLGEQRVILPSRIYGWRNFPDQPLTFIAKKRHYRVFIVVPPATWLAEGPDMASLSPVVPHPVLGPGPPTDFDNGYAGIFGAYHDQASGQLLVFYHAEDHLGFPATKPGEIPAAYFSIGMASSRDNGLTFTKHGPIITSPVPKRTDVSRTIQGVGEGSICTDPTGAYLYCYFSDKTFYTPEFMAASGWKGPSGNILLARSRISDRGEPGSWTKLYQGAFSEPGLGGKHNPVIIGAWFGEAHATYPNVYRIPEWGCYVMVFSIVNSTDPSVEGFYVASSADGIMWSEPSRLLGGLRSHPMPGEPLAWWGTLDLESITEQRATGWLYYAYSPAWSQAGFERLGRSPHFLCARPITFSRV